MDLNVICRICLSKKYDMNDIFNVVDIIKTIAPIQLEREDGLPTVICSDCSLQANQAYNFRQLCIQSDDALRQQRLLSGNEEEYDCGVHDDNFKEQLEEVVLQVKEEILLEDENDVYINTQTDNTENVVENEPEINYEVNKEENTNESNVIANFDLDKNTNSQEIKIRNCPVCDKQFDNNSDYNMHRRMHKIELKCHECGKTYENYGKLARHGFMHKQKGTYLCNVCGKTFTRRENLKMHEKIHAGIKGHKCHVCDKAFVQSGELKSHMLKHNTERAHLCNICGNKYRRISLLRNHIKSKHSMSTGERLHICVCGKGFKDRRNLNDHKRRVHATGRKFICEFCNKEFKLKKGLRQHEKIHKGDRPFVCSICERAFKFKHVLQSHMNMHSKSPNTST